jgi:hypothetical protein
MTRAHQQRQLIKIRRAWAESKRLNSRRASSQPTTRRSSTAAMPADLSDVSLSDILKELQHRVECTLKPEKRIVLVGEQPGVAARSGQLRLGPRGAARRRWQCGSWMSYFLPRSQRGRGLERGCGRSIAARPGARLQRYQRSAAMEG